MSSTRCVLAIAVFAVLVRLATGTARADDPPMAPEARALWDEGQALYAAGDYAAAIERFERGRAIEPRAEFLYAIGQAERKAGNCRAAIERYRAFIVESRSDKQVEAARLQIDRCEQELADQQPAQPAPTTSPTVATAPPPVAPSEPRDEAPGRRWYRDPLGLGLLAAGVAVAGTGVFFAVRSTASLDDQDTYSDWQGQLDDRRQDRAVAITLGAAGGALLAGALVRFWLLPDASPTRAALIPHGRGALLVVEGALW